MRPTILLPPIRFDKLPTGITKPVAQILAERVANQLLIDWQYAEGRSLRPFVPAFDTPPYVAVTSDIKDEAGRVFLSIECFRVSDGGWFWRNLVAHVTSGLTPHDGEGDSGSYDQDKLRCRNPVLADLIDREWTEQMRLASIDLADKGEGK